MVPAATGRGVLQRTQLRSPGGLATPHAGLVHMLGGVSGSAVLLSPWSRKPQSMQAMAPSSSLAPHEGHVVAPGPGAGGMGGKLIEPKLDGWLGGGLLALLLAAPTGCNEGRFTGEALAAPPDWKAGTMNGLLHEGQRTVRPA